MKRLFPAPVLSMHLFAVWILLMQEVSFGTLLLGLGLAIAWPAITAGLRPAKVHVRQPLVMFKLLVYVIILMLRSNAEVAWAILAQRSSAISSGFVAVPLELKDPHGLAVLAMIVTFTPGTAWVQLSADRKALLLHVLAVQDEAALVRFVKEKFERPLMEIFQ